jgi:hypothetical protein
MDFLQSVNSEIPESQFLKLSGFKPSYRARATAVCHIKKIYKITVYCEAKENKWVQQEIGD